jgi:hypothetical protein
MHEYMLSLLLVIDLMHNALNHSVLVDSTCETASYDASIYLTNLREK